MASVVPGMDRVDITKYDNPLFRVVASNNAPIYINRDGGISAGLEGGLDGAAFISDMAYRRSGPASPLSRFASSILRESVGFVDVSDAYRISKASAFGTPRVSVDSDLYSGPKMVRHYDGKNDTSKTLPFKIPEWKNNLAA